ncbi:MAG: DNA repair protein RecO [Betaproteobacteria bacterium]
MATRALAQRHDDEPAFVLHAYPYRETSLIVEAFTERHGRVPMVARGAKRPRSELRGLLQAFQLLTLSWAGAGEMKTLVKAEWRGGMPLPRGSSLLCGFYVNELLLKLLPREDAHAQLFTAYAQTLRSLASATAPAAQAALLRRFELRLLAELGYALPLARDVESGTAIDAAGLYHYAPERGPRLATRYEAREPDPRLRLVRGATLIALATEDFSDPDSAAEAKRLMREVLDHYLDARHIFSRRVVRDLQTIDEEGQDS